MATPKTKTFSSLIIGTALAFILGISFYSYFAHFSSLDIKSALADEDKEENEDEDEDEDKDEDENKDDEDKDDDKNETEKKKLEAAKEKAKKSAVVSVKKDEDEDEDGDEDEDENEEEGDDEDEDGEDVEDEDEDGGVKKDTLEKIREINRDASKVAARISLLEVGGADVSAFKASLQGILEEARQLGERIATNASTGYWTSLEDDNRELRDKDAEESAKAIDKKLEALKKKVYVALGDDEDEDEDENEDENESKSEDNDDDNDGDKVAKVYKNSVAQFVHQLLAAADREGGIGQQVKEVAKEQAKSQEKVEAAVKKVESRGKAAKFFFGPDYKNLKEVRKEIAKNQNRINVLKQIVDNIQDQDAKTIIQNQISVLERENSNLKNFVDASSDQTSLFGWLVRLFS